MIDELTIGLARALTFFEKGGVLTWPILACSLIALAIIIERWWTYRKAVQGPLGWFPELLDVVSKGDFAAAAELAGKTSHPSARLLSALLEKINISENFSRAPLEKLATHYGTQEVREFERYLPALATIGNVAPLLGLTGTVLGMVKAFMQIEAMSGKVNASVLAGGIWEALLTTLFGLSVAIPTVIAHNYLAARVHRIAAEVQDHAVSFLDAAEEAVLDLKNTGPGGDRESEPVLLAGASSKSPERNKP